MSAADTIVVVKRTAHERELWTANRVQDVEGILNGTAEAQKLAVVMFPFDQGIWFTSEGAFERAGMLGALLAEEIGATLGVPEPIIKFLEIADDGIYELDFEGNRPKSGYRQKYGMRLSVQNLSWEADGGM